VPWSDLVGHERVVSMLRRALAEDRLHHALLLHGPVGVGKATLARLFTQALLCVAPGQDGPCGACGACRRVTGEVHPDLSVVRLEESTSTGRLRQEIVIEQIRDLSRFLQFRPLEGARRIAIVDPADRMNPAAANAFLKTLEEPPSSSLILLITSMPASLLPTIRSRCQPVPLGRLPREAVEEALRRAGHDGRDARLASALTDGAYGRALALLGPGEEGTGEKKGETVSPLERFRQRRDRVLEALTAVAGRTDGAGTFVVKVAETFSPKEPEEFLPNLDVAAALLRDALTASCDGGEPGAGADVPERIAELGRRLTPERAAAAVAVAERIRGDLRLNVSRLLAIEFLLSELVSPAPRRGGAPGRPSPAGARAESGRVPSE